MCGILAILCNRTPVSINKIINAKKVIRLRGPDTINSDIKPSGITVFARLAINDLSSKGGQPFVSGENRLMCNGQIYNYRELIQKHELVCQSGSDCEVILRLYEKIGFEETIKQLDGVFAIVLITKTFVYTARDRLGIRPLYIGLTKEDNFISFASVPEALSEYCINIQEHSCGYGMKIDRQTYSVEMFPFSKFIGDGPEIEGTFESKTTEINHLITNAVKKRLSFDRKGVACLLSGGVDSSIIASILSREIGGENVNTFSIGFEDSTDIVWARKVANHLGTKHTEVIVTEQEALDVIPEVIKTLASYDITTVRASTMMFMLCRYIATNTSLKILFSGEVADEMFASYLYFHSAPSDEDIKQESIRLMNEIHKYDVLRADRCISSNGLEARVPFGDIDVVDYCMRLSGADKNPKQSNGVIMEKYILRKAFEGYLPDEILFRKKEAFSDGVSSTTRSWFQIIQEYVSNIHFNNEKEFVSKEACYYYNIFRTYFPTYEPNIPYWLPRWSGDVTDPSARVLKVYDEIN
jgi:asparagine synthase (glutamine-hydrolysing)